MLIWGVAGLPTALRCWKKQRVVRGEVAIAPCSKQVDLALLQAMLVTSTSAILDSSFQEVLGALGFST